VRERSERWCGSRSIRPCPAPASLREVTEFTADRPGGEVFRIVYLY
jgi:hypothetical protein